MKSSGPGLETYADKTPVNLNAKNMDINLHNTQDAPTGPKQRQMYREVVAQLQKNLADAGIPMTTADVQSVLWYSEQSLFKRAGALKKGSDTSDYLDAAYSLVKKYAPKADEPVLAPAR